MIVDLEKFIADERTHWAELAAILDRLEADPGARLDVERAKRFHYLYQRASADLAKIITFASEPQTRRYLELLVARAYGEIHETRDKPRHAAFIEWFFRTFPQTFRRHARAFWIATACMAAGAVFGGFAISFDSDAKQVIMPFCGLQGDPSERVRHEERAAEDRLESSKTAFSSYLMTHNTRVSIFTLAMGMTWGVGTIIFLFYNGAILGAVALDYMLAGETKFLVGWLLPHGAIEIPAVLVAGQAGLVLGAALIGWGDRTTLRARLRGVSRDLVTLIGGCAVLLVWAGFVEAFLSQYHEPLIPYSVKIAFGCVELILLAVFLGKSGAKQVQGSTFKVQS